MEPAAQLAPVVGKCCTKCRTTKGASEFGPAKHHADGLASQCRACVNAAHRDAWPAWYAAHRDELREKTRNYYRKHRDAILEAARPKQRAYYAANREKQLAWWRAYRQQNRNLILEQRRGRYRKNPALARAERLKVYGLTPEDVERMISAQHGACAICLQPLGSGREIAIDHCHDTGIVRGVLCRPCNQGIGFLGDDADRMLRAAAYVGARRR